MPTLLGMSTEERSAHFVDCQEIGRDTYIITFQADDDDPLDYEPGHVFALVYEHDDQSIKHPYTIIEASNENRQFSFCFKHIPDGKLTPLFLTMDNQSQITFSGKHHKPIQQEINQAATAVLGVGTGSGVGPLYGYIKKHINDITVPHHFYFGYRHADDIALKNELDALQQTNDLFTWDVCLSAAPDDWDGLSGHVHLAAAKAHTFNKTTHVHMVGNGQMINELRTALMQVNLPVEFITKESFFKHGDSVRPDIVSELKQRITTK